MLLGGHGVIRSPPTSRRKLMHELCAAALVGDVKKARELHLQLLPLHQQLFVEANPIPVKWAMARMGLHRGAACACRSRRSPSSIPPDAVREALARSRHRACRGLRVVEGRGLMLKSVAVVLATRSACSAALLAPAPSCSRATRSTTRAPRTLPPLEVPPDLTAPTRDNRYAVPDGGASRRRRCRATRPSGAMRASAAAGVRDVAARPSSACASSAPARSAGWWCRTAAGQAVAAGARFLAGERLPSSRTSAEVGVMETDWAENRAKIPQDVIRSTLGKLHRLGCTRPRERDKFRTRLERTRQRQAPRSTSATAAWTRSTPRRDRKHDERPSGSRAPPIRSSRPNSCAA